MSDKKIAVIEMFGPTIQGEGPLAGSKTMFIRFGGCDSRCTKCDSLHAVMPDAVKANATYLTAQEIAEQIIEKAAATNTYWVTLSGGNPAMWDLAELVELLQEADMMVAVETQATLWRDWLNDVECLVLSPKGPGMGEIFHAGKFINFITKVGSRPLVALKVVMFSQQDIEFGLEVAEIAASEGQVFPAGLKYFSLGNESPPELGEAQTLVESEPEEGLVNQLLRNYRVLLEDFCNDPRTSSWSFLPQIHVLVFGNEAER